MTSRLAAAGLNGPRYDYHFLSFSVEGTVGTRGLSNRACHVRRRGSLMFLCGAGWKKRHLVKFGRADRMVETHADHVGPRGRETQSYTRALSTIYFPLYRSSLGKIFEEQEALTRPRRVHVDPRGTKIYDVLIVAGKKVRRFLEYDIYIYVYIYTRFASRWKDTEMGSAPKSGSQTRLPGLFLTRTRGFSTFHPSDGKCAASFCKLAIQTRMWPRMIIRREPRERSRESRGLESAPRGLGLR